jgi:glycosyltransferase involved in cell wall biosynthesis
MQAAYDILISANNETDFGRKGIQYVHFPWAYHPRPKVDLRWYHGSSTMVDAYYCLCTCLSGVSFERMKQNVTLVNSNWTGEKVRERHGIASITLYPPVPGNFPDSPWQDKEDGFVCIGRIAPEKELDKIIDIIAAVRACGHAVHLHIIGTADNPSYHRHIRRRASQNAAWLFLNENLSREELVQLVSRHRYGIHGMTEEHFGMAVAEMVRGGCLVFVPHGGGQVEIVGNEERLLYESAVNAVAKIVQVLSDTDTQSTLHAYLATRKQLFSTECFLRHFQSIVRDFTENL